MLPLFFFLLLALIAGGVGSLLVKSRWRAGVLGAAAAAAMSWLLITLETGQVDELILIRILMTFLVGLPVSLLSAYVARAAIGPDARHPPHCCQNCGYDLTGNTSGTCPECGHVQV